ncbi:hypothetical protein ABID56_000837 [Alkalibacillus flavidus]|uniref:Uncharacterized protein n=1 Tax=Alkalibacillus flavidus TaxID=546021 RepID=A0ABV2KT41_9BACI
MTEFIRIEIACLDHLCNNIDINESRNKGGSFLFEWLFLPLIVAISLTYYAHKNKLNHQQKLKELDLEEKQLELDIMREKNGSFKDGEKDQE